jgi:hypothetical protein
MPELNLFKASHQWAHRPADERFATVQEMHSICAGLKDISVKKYMTMEQMNLHADADSNEILVDIPDIGETKFSNWGFSQLCLNAEAPPVYLRKLPAPLAVENIKFGLKTVHYDDLQLLIHHGEENKLCRSIMTPSYKRIYNADITQRLMGLLDYGWRVPPARPAFPGQDGTRIATLDDVLDMEKFSLSVKVGDEIAPAGLYASDHDMFAFMIDPTKYLEDGSGHPLYRGFFVWNSEVGASVFGVQTFLFRHVCGNHIVWGATNVKIIRVKHIGAAEFLFRTEFQQKLIEVMNAPFTLEQELINKARNKILGADKDEVVETIQSKRFI